MKTSIKNVSETKVIATITVEANELEAARQVALKKFAKTVKVAGFRKGNAPLEMVAKNTDPNDLINETVNNALSKAVAEAFLENKVQVLDRPEVEVKKFVPFSELEFTAEADVLPKVTLGDYKKLKLKPVAVKIDKSDVDDVIERLQKGLSEKTETKDAAKDGDEVVLDFVGKQNDEPFEGGTAKDYPLVLGSGSFIPGFEEALVGHKTGESFDIPLSFPKDYQAKKLAGQKVVFSVTIKKVNSITLLELNDEFAAKAGPFTSMDDLRKDVEAEITAQKEREANDALKDEAVKQLVAKSSVAVPEILRQDQLRSIEQDMTQNLMYQGMQFEQYLEQKGYKDKDEWIEKEARAAADERVKAGLVLAELSKAEKVEATADELAERINVFKQQYANNPDMAKRFDEPEVQHEIANRLLTEKTVNMLVEINTPKTKK